jgi:hypothetical protein
MFEVRLSTCRPSPSRASAKQSRSGIQNAWLNRALRSAASASSRPASAGSPHTSRASPAMRIFASYT